MKNLKRLLAFFLAFCLTLSLTATSFAAGPERSGTVGDSGVTWSLSDTGRLTIGGSGDAEQFDSPKDQPWAAVRSEIREVWFAGRRYQSAPCSAGGLLLRALSGRLRGGPR